MHRLLVDKALLGDNSPRLPKEAEQHLKVLRPKAGEKIELFDGEGRTRHYSVSLDGRSFLLNAVDELKASPRPEFALTLFACVTKGSRWDWTIEKATELGVTKIVPVISERTIVRIAPTDRASKRERWQRIAEDAARQSDAVYLPEILPAVDFDEAVKMAAKTKCFIGALTSPPSPMLAEAIAQDGVARNSGLTCEYAVFIGPEGDFTPEELSSLMKVATPTSFGSTILRAETAAIFALSVIKGLKG